MKCFNATTGILCRRVRASIWASIIACGLFCAVKASANTHLIIHFKDGSATSFVLADKPSVTFEDKYLRVHAKQVDTDFELANVAKFVFGDGTSSLETIEAQEVRFTIPDCDHVTVSGLKCGETVRAISIDGRIQATVRASEDGYAELNLTDLAKGIYVIATESGKTIKMKH